MKYQYNIFLAFVIIFFACVCQANSLCDGAPTPKLNIRFNYGKVTYINNKSNNQFPQKPYSTVMGLTVSDLKRQVGADTQIISDSYDNYCVYIQQLNVEIGYPKVDVYIDKKYRPGSCNYNVVKEHENYHVRVQQEGLKFFAPKIKEAYQIALNKIKPQSAFTQGDAKRVAEDMIQRIERDVEPMMSYVQERLREENAVIDTEQAYIKDAKKCPKW